jgi:hypothetical protein
VSFPLALLAIPATGLIAAHHAAQQGAGQDGGRVRHLLNKPLAGSSELRDLVFHLHQMKDYHTLKCRASKKQQDISKLFGTNDRRCGPQRARFG